MEFNRSAWELEMPLACPTQQALPTPTRWTTDFASIVNLPLIINFKALCGTNLVMLPPECWANKTIYHQVYQYKNIILQCPPGTATRVDREGRPDGQSRGGGVDIHLLLLIYYSQA